MSAGEFVPPRLRQLGEGAEVWWSARSARERILLAALLVILLVTLLVVTVIAPLRAVRAEALGRIRSAAVLDARLRAGEPGGWARVRHGDAQAIVNDSLTQAGISAQSVSLEGAGIRVVVADVAFTRIAGWMAEVEQTSRLRVVQAQVDRTASPGHVSAAVLVRE